MGLTGTELHVIKVFASFKEASSALVAKQVMITPGYAEYLCKYLLKEGYLEITNHGMYCLTPKGREAITGRSYQALLDRKTIQSLAQELAKQLGTLIPSSTIKTVKGGVVPEESVRREIKIKESFVDPMEQGIILKHSLSRKPKELRTSSVGIEKTLKALKKLK